MLSRPYDSCRLGFLTALALLTPGVAFPSPATISVWHYQLVEGSFLVDDCLICGRPAYFAALRGDYDLVLEDQNPLFTTYLVTNLHFTAGHPSGLYYDIQGHGTYQIGGEVALQQSMTLLVSINDQPVTLTNSASLVRRLWPMMTMELEQSKRNELQFFTFSLAAAPMREFWFSTASGFTPADFNQPRGSPGDLFSSSGRVVATGRALLDPFQLSPSTANDLGLDAFAIAPGGEILFSLNEPQTSDILGPLGDGDILSARGHRLHSIQELLKPFGLILEGPDPGVDAISIHDDGEVIFSVKSDILSPTAGWLRRGDLLSSQGVKYRTYDQIVARFHAPKEQDYGLDAVHLWPSGEIWFSLEEGFQDEELGPVQAGDLLSDQGYVVARNLDILNPFQPVEDLADFGLDGLFVVTDVAAQGIPPNLEALQLSGEPETVSLQWHGPGRVFQVQKASNLGGPWHDASPIVPGVTWSSPRTGRSSYFRLKQW